MMWFPSSTAFTRRGLGVFADGRCRAREGLWWGDVGLPSGVNGFFDLSGSACFIQRAVDADCIAVSLVDGKSAYGAVRAARSGLHFPAGSSGSASF